MNEKHPPVVSQFVKEIVFMYERKLTHINPYPFVLTPI